MNPIEKKRIIIKPLITLIIGFMVFVGYAQEVQFENGKAVSVTFNQFEDGAQNVKIYLEGSSTSLLGTYFESKETVKFIPALPFQPGKSYQIVFNKDYVLSFKIAEGEKSTPELLAIYPTTDTIPENLLKIYLEFSEPMQANSSYKHLIVKNDSGKTITPFLELSPELWNMDNTILTVWLDPGRIKNQLLKNLELGKPLDAGKPYELHVRADWKSQKGQSLQESYAKNFYTGPKDQRKLSVQDWKIMVPQSGTKDPLKISFGEVLDHQLLKECFVIESIDGRFEPRNEDKEIWFYPAHSWQSGAFTVKIESRLEDLAGNNLNRPFDRDVTVEEKGDYKFYSLSFEIE